MTNKILASFSRKSFEDSGRDQSPDYYVYEFTNITDLDGTVYSDMWIKETKLLEAITFQKGKQYEITLSEKVNLNNTGKLPYPIKISWGKCSVYIKGGNSIIRVDENGNEMNLSIPLNFILRNL